MGHKAFTHDNRICPHGAHITLPSNLQTLIDSLEGPGQPPLDNINVPFALSHEIWDWACAMETEYKEATKHLPGSVIRLHAILLPQNPDPALSNEFMDILTPFKDVTELRKHLKLMKTRSTSGPIGITVEHLLYASDQTLGAFLLPLRLRGFLRRRHESGGGKPRVFRLSVKSAPFTNQMKSSDPSPSLKYPTNRSQPPLPQGSQAYSSSTNSSTQAISVSYKVARCQYPSASSRLCTKEPGRNTPKPVTATIATQDS
jgi:hypothetical protein